MILSDLLAQLNRANLVVHPETTDYLPYYAAADLSVCSSYEESSPRVILEAMACDVPILSSGVHGVPEQVRPELEATLVPPGDTVALCEHGQAPAFARYRAHPRDPCARPRGRRIRSQPTAIAPRRLGRRRSRPGYLISTARISVQSREYLSRGPGPMESTTTPP